MTPAMYNPYNTGTAAAGGKGGTMGGFGGGSMGGKGGMSGGTPQTPAAPPTAPPTAPPVAPAPAPVAEPDPVQNAQGPNAFETGINAQNSAMDFYQNQMANAGNGMNQQYTDMITSMIQNMSGGTNGGYMGGGGGGGGMSFDFKAPGQELYNYDPTLVDASTYDAAKLSDMDIAEYMNPYTDSVIDSTMADLDKARLTALNSTGAAASRGGAFGGDRHGIMEAQNNNDYLSQVARSSAQLRNQGYQNAQAAAMNDLGAMNQSRATNAAMNQQASAANASAMNARDQFVGQTANSNEMAAQQANMQMALSGRGGTDGGAADRRNAAASQQAALTAAMQMQQLFMNGSNNQAAMRSDAADQVYNMGSDRYQMGQDALNAMGDVGSQIDSQNQSLIDAQRRDFERLTGAPQDQYQQMLAALSSLTGSGTTTSSYEPGAFDYLKAGTGMFGLGK